MIEIRMNPERINRRTQLAYLLIAGGVPNDIQVSAAAGFLPDLHPERIEKVSKIRAAFLEPIEPKFPVMCNHCRRWRNVIPCIECNLREGRHLSFSVSGPQYDAVVAALTENEDW